MITGWAKPLKLIKKPAFAGFFIVSGALFY